jgi:hypothetical protein
VVPGGGVALIRHYGTMPLQIEEVSEPSLRPGSAIVRVLGALIPPSVAETLPGRYISPTDAPQNLLILPPMPHTPGFDCVGIEESSKSGRFGLQSGQGARTWLRVGIESRSRSRDRPAVDAGTARGLSDLVFGELR